MRSRVQVMGIALLGSMVLLFPAEAGACSGYLCNVNTAPAEGVTIPANAPALVAQATLHADIQSFELEGGDAATPAHTLEITEMTSGQGTGQHLALLKLDEPLVPGTTYRLTARSRCRPLQDEPVEQAPVTFTTGAARALPSAIGSAAVTYLQAKLGGRHGYGPDGYVSMLDSKPGATVAQITIEPSAELTPYLPVTRFSTYVDGNLWGESHYGHGPASYDVPDQVTFRDFTRIYTTCTREAQSSACESSGVAAGTHEVEVRAHVAGAATDPPPLRLQVQLSCPSDGGLPDSGAPNAALGKGDTSNDDGGGCAIGKSRSARDASMVALGVLFVSATSLGMRKLRRRAQGRQGRTA